MVHDTHTKKRRLQAAVEPTNNNSAESLLNAGTVHFIAVISDIKLTIIVITIALSHQHHFMIIFIIYRYGLCY